MIGLIACINKANYIGKNNRLLYDNKEDMEYFTKVTKKYHYCLIGKNTFDSLPKPLEDRENVVIVDDVEDRSLKHYKNVQYIYKHDVFNYLLTKARNNELDVIVIGGEFVYNLIMNSVNFQPDELHITVVDDTEKGDTAFPFIDNEKYSLVSRKKIDYSRKVKNNITSLYDAEIRVYKRKVVE